MWRKRHKKARLHRTTRRKMAYNPRFDQKLVLRTDFGLQAERTSLAWNRTTLACLINGLLLLRSAVKLNSFLFAVLSALMLVCTVFMHGYSRQKKPHGVNESNSLHLKIIAQSIALCSAILAMYFVRQILP